MGKSGALEWVRSLGVAVVLFLLIRFFFVQTFVITSGSMENGLLVGDLLVANRLAFGAHVPGTEARLPGYGSPDRGDVVVFDPHHDTDQMLVKRLVGLPGDTLQMIDGELLLNGVRQEEPYVKHEDPGNDAPAREMAWQNEHLLAREDSSTYMPTRDTWGPLVVPEGHYFMLGDNRDASYDSRYWGPLAEWRVEGKVEFIYYSIDRSLSKPFPWVTAVRWGRIGHGVT